MIATILMLLTDVTSKTTLDAYHAIAVPELWIYDSGRLKIYLLKEGSYQASNNSELFPEIPITEMIHNDVVSFFYRR